MTRSTQVKTDKIVAYHPDGSRQTLGYRVEQRTEQKIRHRARPPFSAYVDRDPTLKPGNTTPDGRSKTYITNPPRKLPPVVHTEHFKREKHKTLAGPSNLPAGWKHKETKERYDYHKGMKEASYAANTVTHKVMFFGPSPWDHVKDGCHTMKEDLKKEGKTAKKAVVNWWKGTTF